MLGKSTSQKWNRKTENAKITTPLASTLVLAHKRKIFKTENYVNNPFIFHLFDFIHFVILLYENL